jgi:hypothetical protein
MIVNSKIRIFVIFTAEASSFSHYEDGSRLFSSHVTPSILAGL